MRISSKMSIAHRGREVERESESKWHTRNRNKLSFLYVSICHNAMSNIFVYLLDIYPSNAVPSSYPIVFHLLMRLVWYNGMLMLHWLICCCFLFPPFILPSSQFHQTKALMSFMAINFPSLMQTNELQCIDQWAVPIGSHDKITVTLTIVEWWCKSSI